MQVHDEKARAQAFLELAREMERRYEDEEKRSLAQERPGGDVATVQQGTVNDTLPAVDSGAERPRFFGQSLPVAAASFVQNSGKPLTEAEILEGLIAGGIKMVSAKPLANLRFALRRRPDLLRYDGGKWHAVIDVTTLPLPPTGAVPNRAPDQHLRKTMEGMAAARERGVVGGRRPMFDDAERNRVFALLADGKSVREVSQEAGVSRSLIYNWIRAKAAKEADREGAFSNED